MDIKSALQTVVERRNLTQTEMMEVMRSIMTGEVTPAQIGGFLIGLRMKGETVEEISAAVQIMRELVNPVIVNDPYLVDIVGTGGDNSHTFNVSTTSAFVVAAAGGKVAKHGNRSVSSKSGSADVLEALGIHINLSSEQVALCIQEVGFGFMFAPLHHSAMKHAIGPRREMGVRTIFNLLGPMTNPARVTRQLIGVFDPHWLMPIAQVLKQLHSEHILVVHSEDGLDEISLSAPTQIVELKHGQITHYLITPEQFGFTTTPLNTIRVQSVTESVNLVHSVLNNQAGPARDIVVLNAGATIYVAGLTSSLQEGIQRAQTVLATGAAREKLNAIIQITQRF